MYGIDDDCGKLVVRSTYLYFFAKNFIMNV